ncbi:MAG: radical SAM protein [Ruminococcaceae bacterium]|nr:radical SAM protein [Oscillospiraceae bacterium]
MSKAFTCRLCPRQCSVIRTASEKGGYCGCTSIPFVAAACLHFWEEPCISGTKGSGTVFFSSCNLRCVYCQNIDFSRKETGIPCTPEKLADIFLSLQEKGAHNINLVTPTPHVYSIAEALDLCSDKLNIPVVYNSSGYESADTIDLMSKYADIFLLDYKYFSDDAAREYSDAANYSRFASEALAKILKTHGKMTFDDDGMMKRGIIVRHLVLPNHYKDSLDVLEEINRITGTDNIYISLMSQYLPNNDPHLPKALKRKTTTLEYEKVCRHAQDLGFKGYFQMRSSAKEGYVPTVGNIIK